MTTTTQTTHSPYAWVITWVNLEILDAKEKGTQGPRTIGPDQERQLATGHGHQFRMRDDDGNELYRGRYLGDPASEDAFGPLWDFGGPNAGCTEIQYATDKAQVIERRMERAARTLQRILDKQPSGHPLMTGPDLREALIGAGFKITPTDHYETL